MRNFKKSIFRLLILIIFLCYRSSFLPINAKHEETPPQLTVVMVIDQFAYHYIEKLRNNFNYGFKFLLERSIFYSNAHHPHGGTTTATGHTALNTGTLAKDHGIIQNKWYEGTTKVRMDDDNTIESQVFNAHDFQPYGKSAKRIMVDGISDQFILNAPKFKPREVFSLSFKSRAAIGMGGKLGKAIWFDKRTNMFTSSKAFFKKLPGWLTNFNNKKVKKSRYIPWKLAYPAKSKYYKLRQIDHLQKNNYQETRYKTTLIGKDLTQKLKVQNVDFYLNKKQKMDSDLILKTPFANQLLLDLAKTCLDNELNNKNQLLLWISLSPLDWLGHIYGPQSLEVTDMIYHLDKQILNFIKYLEKKVGKNNFLFILTADHGVESIPEIIQQYGFREAKRINVLKLIEKMNQLIKEKYEIDDIVLAFFTTQFFLNKEKLNKLDKPTKNAILEDLKTFLKKQPGTKNAWTFKELKNMSFHPFQLEEFYKNQLFPGRSGNIICQPHPYCTFTPYETGTSHRSAYDYNTHIPLFVYQKHRFEKKQITQKVWSPQLPVSLARILEVSKPSASPFQVLPGLFKE